MSKRAICQDDMALFKKKQSKIDYTEAAKALKEQCENAPHDACYAKYLLEGLAQSSDSPRDKATEPWPNTYGVLSKLPKNIKQDLLRKDVITLKDSLMALWRLDDSQITQHLFEFQFCVAPEFIWPQGPCHRKGMPEKVLKRWAQHIQAKHPQGQPRLEGILSDELRRGPVFPWATLGVYSSSPQGPQKRLQFSTSPVGKDNNSHDP